MLTKGGRERGRRLHRQLKRSDSNSASDSSSGGADCASSSERASERASERHCALSSEADCAIARRRGKGREGERERKQGEGVVRRRRSPPSTSRPCCGARRPAGCSAAPALCIVAPTRGAPLQRRERESERKSVDALPPLGVRCRPRRSPLPGRGIPRFMRRLWFGPKLRQRGRGGRKRGTAVAVAK